MPYAELSDVRCYYELLGSGDPLLLIPGLGTTCLSWDCTAAKLSESFSLILADNRGVGRSVAKRTPQSLDNLAVDWVELLDYLQLERAHVLGISLGGIIAQKLAVDHPGRVDRLVLISTTHRFRPYLMEIAKLLGQALRHFPTEVYLRTVELLSSGPQYLDAHIEEIDRKIASAREAGASRSALARQLRCLASCHGVAEGEEYRIDAPTLVIAGDQDMLIPACYARQMAEKIPGSQFLLLPECGHNPLIEKPEVVLPRIAEFLLDSRKNRLPRFEGVPFKLQGQGGGGGLVRVR